MKLLIGLDLLLLLEEGAIVLLTELVVTNLIRFGLLSVKICQPDGFTLIYFLDVHVSVVGDALSQHHMVEYLVTFQ